MMHDVATALALVCAFCVFSTATVAMLMVRVGRLEKRVRDQEGGR